MRRGPTAIIGEIRAKDCGAVISQFGESHVEAGKIDAIRTERIVDQIMPETRPAPPSERSWWRTHLVGLGFAVTASIMSGMLLYLFGMN